MYQNLKKEYMNVIKWVWKKQKDLKSIYSDSKDLIEDNCQSNQVCLNANQLLS